MNILKPKKTTFNAPALVYRRFTRLESSRQKSIVFKCLQKDNVSYSYWVFDLEQQKFVSTEDTNLSNNTTYVLITTDKQVYQSGQYYFVWLKYINNWYKTTTLPEDYTTLENAGYSNIGTKYQTNQFYCVGQINYIITGEVAGTKTQPIKGVIMPLQSMNIKYYDDGLTLDQEDLVVVNGALYTVEDPDYSIKHMPRPYKIYYATLNSIM